MAPAQVRELLSYRTLLRELVIREFRAKYKRSWLGVLWSLLNPLLLMLVYTLVFSVIARVKIANYPMLLLPGLLAWNFLSGALGQGVTSVVRHADLIKKVYLPREVLPVATVGANLINFGISLVLLVPFILFFHIHEGWPLLLLPVLIVLEAIFVTGAALLVASLDVYLRDIEHLIQVLLLIWFFATPIIYPYSGGLLSQRVSTILLVNPLTWLMDSYQRILYWNLWPRPEFLAAFTAAALVVLVGGAIIFGRLKWSFAEEL
jgi:lipopolysaccharide transport system permease protein